MLSHLAIFQNKKNPHINDGLKNVDIYFKIASLQRHPILFCRKRLLKKFQVSFKP